MQVIDRETALWNYLTPELQGLIDDGEELIDHAIKHGEKASSDFSYLVFSFAKAYEGYIKKLFLDMSIIREDEYFGDDIRIGRILNPNYMKEHDNIFSKFCGKSTNGKELARELWEVWRKGRNQVFHYFPHNFRRIDYDEALEIIDAIVTAMYNGVVVCDVANSKSK